MVQQTQNLLHFIAIISKCVEVHRLLDVSINFPAAVCSSGVSGCFLYFRLCLPSAGCSWPSTQPSQCQAPIYMKNYWAPQPSSLLEIPGKVNCPHSMTHCFICQGLQDLTVSSIASQQLTARLIWGINTPKETFVRFFQSCWSSFFITSIIETCQWFIKVLLLK